MDLVSGETYGHVLFCTTISVAPSSWKQLT